MPALSKACLPRPSSKASLIVLKLSFQKQVLDPQIIAKNNLCRDFQRAAVTWGSWQPWHPMRDSGKTQTVSGHMLQHGWAGLNCRFLLPSTAHGAAGGIILPSQSEPLINISLRHLKPPKEIHEIAFRGPRLQLQFRVPAFMMAVSLQSWGAKNTPALKCPDENHPYNSLLKPHWHEQQCFSCWNPCYHEDRGLPGSLGYSSALEVRAWLSLWGFEVADSASEESFFHLVKGHNMRMGTLHALRDQSHTWIQEKRQEELGILSSGGFPTFQSIIRPRYDAASRTSVPISQGVPLLDHSAGCLSCALAPWELLETSGSFES